MDIQPKTAAPKVQIIFTVKHFRYLPKIVTSLSFLLLFVVMAALFHGRKSDLFHVDELLFLFPDMYQHISNFTISYMFVAGIGYFWLFMGVEFKYILMLGILVMGINFIYELWLPFLNTKDIYDALYGLWGVLLAMIFLFFTKQYGLCPNPNAIE